MVFSHIDVLMVRRMDAARPTRQVFGLRPAIAYSVTAPTGRFPSGPGQVPSRSAPDQPHGWIRRLARPCGVRPAMRPAPPSRRRAHQRRWMSVSRARRAARSRSNESHSNRLLAATDIGAVFSAMSRCQRGGQYLAGIQHAAAQPQMHRPVAVESRAGQEDFGGVRDADQPRQHPVRVGVADDAAAHLHDAVAARRRRRTGYRIAGQASDPTRSRGR